MGRFAFRAGLGKCRIRTAAWVAASRKPQKNSGAMIVVTKR
jgi:hypothetical protein